jgi:hypothetical protein
MKHLRLLSTVLALLVIFAAAAAAETDENVNARRVALDLAGAFSNEGFKIRDGHWIGAIRPGEKTVIAVNLYAGNQYWFSVGANREAKNLTVDVHDEHGKPVAADHFQAEDKAAAGFSPTISGQYFVSISAGETPESTYCLVYSYK